jgi:NADH:ubiquinone oxidoreductase subunit 4 (subunit M)
MLMTTGIIALAGPLSSAFAGEFLILAGVFRRGWGWAVVGAVAMVLAAMYMLRLISAVLHREIGVSVSDAALDLRPAELAVTVPLVACLLALSAWPAAISGHAFGGNNVKRDLKTAAPATSTHVKYVLCLYPGGPTLVPQPPPPPPCPPTP